MAETPPSDSAPIDPPPTAAAPTPTDKPEPFTPAQQALVNQIVQDRVARAVRDKPRDQPKDKPALSTDDPPAWAANMVEQMTHLHAELESVKASAQAGVFDTAFGAAGLPPSVRDFVRAKFDSDKPQDPAKFMADAAQLFAPTVTPTTAPPPAVTPGSVPTATRDFSGVVDPSTLTREDVARLRSEGRLVEIMEKWRTQGRPGSFFRKRATP